MKKLVLVTGSRKWADYNALARALDSLMPFHLLIHGGNGNADMAAHRWALARGVQLMSMPPNFKVYGATGKNGAGPKRNRAMCVVAADLKTAGWDVVVAAFPAAGKSTGTRGCMAEAVDRGLTVDAPRRTRPSTRGRSRSDGKGPE